MGYECAMTLSCGVAREDFGVPGTDDRRKTPPEYLISNTEIRNNTEFPCSRYPAEMCLKYYSHASNRHPRVLTRGSGF
jgi:hypothetical protein